MTITWDYESHLNPPPDPGPVYEPCPDCEGSGEAPDTCAHDSPFECGCEATLPCQSCDGKGEIRVDP